MISHPYALLQKTAQDEGWDLAGYCNFPIPENDRLHLEEFVRRGYHGEMKWYSNLLHLRLNPQNLLRQKKPKHGKQAEKATGAVVLGSYYRDLNSEEVLQSAKIKIARYAHGKDYHQVLRKKAKKVLALLQDKIPSLEGRITVDSAPVPEKIIGRMAGLGWQGKNTNLIHPQLGSYFFLCTILVNQKFLEETEQEMIPDQCGSCSLCLNACPTGALEEYQIDARKCISYLTIEDKGKISPKYQESLMGWAFGCDICQEVCPYNRNRRSRGKSIQEEAFRLRPEISHLMKEGALPNEQNWTECKEKSPLGRIDLEKIRDNLSFARNIKKGQTRSTHQSTSDTES